MNRRCQFSLEVAGASQGAAQDSAASKDGWATLVFRNVEIHEGDELALIVSGEPLKLDYIQLNAR